MQSTVRATARAVFVVAAAVLVAACGDDDLPAPGGAETALGQEYVAAYAEAIDVESHPFIDRDSLDCVVTAFVDGLGVERLSDMGISPSELGGAVSRGELSEVAEIDLPLGRRMGDRAVACTELSADIQDTVFDEPDEEEIKQCYRDLDILDRLAEVYAVGVVYPDTLLDSAAVEAFDEALDRCSRPPRA